jgi:hypothetical protein
VRAFQTISNRRPEFLICREIFRGTMSAFARVASIEMEREPER